MAYGSREGVELIYGSDNIRQWADVNNQENAGDVQDRVSWALGLAEAHINGRLKYCAYSVPFSDPVDPLVVDMTNRLAGVYLYDSRGMVDVDNTEENQINYHRKMVDYMMRQIHGGQIKLLAHKQNAVNYAQAVGFSE